MLRLSCTHSRGAEPAEDATAYSPGQLVPVAEVPLHGGGAIQLAVTVTLARIDRLRTVAAGVLLATDAALQVLLALFLDMRNPLLQEHGRGVWLSSANGSQDGL